MALDHFEDGWEELTQYSLVVERNFSRLLYLRGVCFIKGSGLEMRGTAMIILMTQDRPLCPNLDLHYLDQEGP